MSASPAADVAIAIVSHNTKPDLLHCLASLADGGLDGVRAQVVVVDNASTDGSAAEAAARHPWASVIANDANVGFATASNQALRSTGFGGSGALHHPRHAMLLNPDTVVPAGAVGALVGALEAEPDLGAVGPKLVLGDGSLDLACRRSFPTPEVSLYRFLSLSRRFPRSRRFGRYNMTFLDSDEPADVDSLVGACMIVRGTAVDQIGLLDERFWMYGEDLDWCFRLHEAGWRVAYRPAVTVHHVKRAASRGNTRAHYEFQRAMWLFYEKHYARSASWPTHLAVRAALAIRGGPRLVREMLKGSVGVAA